ncbi:MAG: hypothetical protein GBAus27B_000150 [Mycoplasmataceae bacterium]|nr:MAG: hypothetical protein GBAus27B_000150 [Mycoplasmataceae bacterium]
MKENFYDSKQKQWAEFTQDCKELLDNYHELLGILEAIEISKLGEVNEKLKKLYQTTNEFLTTYDDNRNGTIDMLELMAQNQIKLAQNLSRRADNQLINIVNSIKKLEEAVTS